MITSSRLLSIIAVLVFIPSISFAQLTDETQTTPNVPGGTIGKSLEEQVGTGSGDEFTPGSSYYLILRDPARSIRRGRQLFQRKFTEDQGQGPRVSNDSTGNIQENRALGAGLSDSCAACHGRPRGSAGFGGDVATRPDSRDAPHLFGLGLVEMLADEITKDLRSIRGEAITMAQENGSSATLELESKGIKYGSITANSDGSVDTSQVVGVNQDLRVRPFFHQGGTISIREFIIGAFRDEMGLQATDPILCSATDPENPEVAISASGMEFDPELDDIERPTLCDANIDGDEDGVVNEIDPAVIDHMEFYLLNYFKPGTGKMTRHAERGAKIMEQIGCTSCHIPDLKIENDRRVADVETEFDPENGIFNRLFATATALFDVVDDGEEYPQLVPNGEPFVVKNIYTDLKRHDLGPAFHEREYDGSMVTEFVTEPLWGVGSTSPYGHDGRSINLEEVILRHGGEAEQSKKAFERLNPRKQEMVIKFLQTLILFPPDDTASNLNPGNPGTNNPQDPAEHGTINLGALFQIEFEGAE